MDENSIEKNLLLASEKQDYFEVVTILNVIRGIQSRVVEDFGKPN